MRLACEGDQCDVRGHGAKRARIDRVNLHAAACLARMFVKRRFERGRARDEAGQAHVVESAGKADAVDPRSPGNIEWTCGASPVGEVRSFEQAAARIDQRGFVRRHVRRRHHERTIPIGSRRFVVHACRANDGHELGIALELGTPRDDVTQREAMSNRQRLRPTKERKSARWRRP